MFVLRRITGESNECNTCLGESYTYVAKERNESEFYRTYQVHLGNDADTEVTQSLMDSLEDKIYAFVVSENGKEVIPLYRPSSYFIMTSNGKTFDNLTFR